MKIYVYKPAMAEIHRIMDQYPEHLECGGQLYGITRSPSRLYVTKAFRPGEGFKPDPDHFGDDFDDVWEKMLAYHQEIGWGWHIASWHTHPMPPPVRRSDGDIRNAKHWRKWYRDAYDQDEVPHGWGGIIVHRWAGKRVFGAWIYDEDGDHKADVTEWDGAFSEGDHIREYFEGAVA